MTQCRAERNTQVSACGTPKFWKTQDGDCSTIKHGLTHSKSRYSKGRQDTSGPVIQLETLTQRRFLLLQRLADVHATHFDDRKAVTTREFKEFLQEIVNRLGAEG